MENYGESVLDLVEEGDLDVKLSCAFILFCKQSTFMEIREMVKNHIQKGERYIHGTASSVKLFVVKEDDYKLLKEIKENRNY